MALVRFEASYIHRVWARQLRSSDWQGMCACGHTDLPRRSSIDEALHDAKLHLKNDVRPEDQGIIYLIMVCERFEGPAIITRTPVLVSDAEWIGIFRAPQPKPEFEICASCGNPVESQDISHLSVLQFQKLLCNHHFEMAKKAAAAHRRP